MPQRKATDELSAEAWKLMRQGFAAGWTAERIAQSVLDGTGETVSARTVARRAAEWREEKRTFDSGVERWKTLLAAAEANQADASQMILALAQDHLLQNPNALDEADPVKVSRTALEAERMRLLRRKVELEERKVATEERRVKLLEDREARLVATVTDERKELTPEQRLREVRSILGLPEVASAA